VAQVGASPNELQLITQVAEYDETAQGLRPIRSYIIRVLGVLEHRIVNFGTTVNNIQILDNHPLLYEYTTNPTALFFRGDSANADEVTMDLMQAHATTFYPWRHFPQYLNMEQPLLEMVKAGGGLIGQMPAPLAQEMIKVLNHHNLEHKTAEGEPYIKVHDNPALLQTKLKVLLFGESYFISYGFSIQEMKGRNPSVE
ncbi:MAG: hypothetical protein WBC91_09180, partial [Phototrophicaceae bacterium]